MAESRKELIVHMLRMNLTVAFPLLGLIAVSCAVLQGPGFFPPMEVEGAEFVGDDTCATCHEEESRNFARADHARIRVPGGDEGESGCEACHGPGSKHVEAKAEGKAESYIVNPSSESCMTCHTDTRLQFGLPFHHPLPEGRMSCNDCHDVHGDHVHQPKGLAMARINDACARCHQEQARPHVFEHEAMREGCVTCHQVHGSINRKMLVQNNNMLCLKCHTQTQATGGTVGIGARGHDFFLGRGTCWTAGCHTAPHGSNVNPHLRY